MKRTILLFLLFASTFALLGATQSKAILLQGTGNPVGGCAVFQVYINTSANTLFYCPAGTWTAIAGGGGSITLPQTIGGTVNSGGVACFTNTTTMASSNALTSNIDVIGGGAGVCPASGSITDTGSAVSTASTVTISNAQALSTYGLNLSGAPITGGTGTTTFPYMNFAQGVTAPTTWSTSGTELGMNAPSGFTGNFLDFHINGGATVASLSSTDTWNKLATNGQANASTFAMNSTGHIFVSQTAPTISSGFGTSPAISNTNGTAHFTINVGTGGTATSGVITMPAANAGWSCMVTPDAAPTAATVTYSAPTSTTSVTLTNYTVSSAAVTAWAASQVFDVNCIGF